ncbi:OLC1v1015662C1 [Oldenlandia corymbosa var. corymbosa]|uniref:OLC1v1015662C1 n=1 Tax=Oldenlandia corymbosa var. corymbosa TaxID=529605 RepID=A0AAV1E6T8_OLDCO|nr:OLC1v1015662C1 [Oldenlandia corymbosa var. corymbosa]
MSLSSPFVFSSTANKFTAFGCDTSAVIRGGNFIKGQSNHNNTTGCMSLCDDNEDVEDRSCSGVGCYEISIPAGARSIDLTVDSFYNHRYLSGFSPCSYGFVVEDAAFGFFVDNLTNVDKKSSVPVVADWVVAYEKCEVAKNDVDSYACNAEQSRGYDPDGDLGYRCKCEDGFEGNPYLPDGCQDINECADPTLHNCADNSICNNTLGGYTCMCNQGFHGDGRKNGVGCSLVEQSDKKKFWQPVVGVSVGCSILMALSICLYFEMMRRKANRMKEEFFRKNGGLILLQKISGEGNTYSTRLFTVEELQKATNHFDERNIIGRGGFGIVFKGELMDKTKVAIKKSRGVDRHQVELFINEVIILSQINNRNAVKLLGCCLETEVPLLVYEFIENGTLSEHLHNKFKATKLSWNIRLRIASEVAGVLSYLHSVASPPIIHRDIKSANILLDQNFTAKVADFGISRLLPADGHQVSTIVQGTCGYLDPEYMQRGRLTEKSDVYSFGIVLIEILTGKRVMESDKPETDIFLSNRFLSSLKEGNVVQLFDSNICCNDNIDQLMEVAKIAERCISVKGADRPYMKDVARDLEALGIEAQRFLVQALKIESMENEALISMESKGFECRNDSSPNELYSYCYSLTEEILLQQDGTSLHSESIVLYGLEIKYWHLNSLSRLVSTIGTPILADDFTVSKNRAQYARILVEMELSETVPDKLVFEDELENVVVQKIIYEWKPTKCSHCSDHGHESTQCRRKEKRVENKNKQPVSAWKEVVKGGDNKVGTVAKGVVTDKVASAANTQSEGSQKGANKVDHHLKPHKASEEVSRGRVVSGEVSSPVITWSPDVDQRMLIAELVTVGELNGKGCIDAGTRTGLVIDPGPSPHVLNLNMELELKDLEEFQYCIEECGISELRQFGKVFTWCNQSMGKDRIYCKLDWVLVNGDWIEENLDSVVEVQMDGISDHTPLVLDLIAETPQKPKLFRYFNMWSQAPSLLRVVQDSCSHQVQGTKMFQVCSKLRRLKKELKI